MNRGLLEKIVREAGPVMLLFALAKAGFEAMMSAVVPLFGEDTLGPMLEMRFFKTLFRGLLGTEVGERFSVGMLTATAWVHPAVLALVWAQEIVFCTRMPAGEIDRGTVDVLLSLPVSRRRLYLCDTVTWLLSGLVMIGAGLIGHLLGRWTVAVDVRPDLAPLTVILVNLYALYVAVGGITMFVSAGSERRGRAVAVVFAFVLGSYLLNFIAQLWEPASRVSFLSILDYYKPMTITRGSIWPVGDIAILLIAGALFWLAGAFVFARRDIRTT